MVTIGVLESQEIASNKNLSVPIEAIQIMEIEQAGLDFPKKKS